MDIPPQLVQYRYHFGIAVLVSLIFSLVLYAAPRILTILNYFWPLFASTTVFLVIIIAFNGGVSHAASEAHGEKAGKGIMDYVAASHHEQTNHDHHQDYQNFDQQTNEVHAYGNLNHQ
ncbi:hypothetical protein FEM48_Zijuj01G0086600 [Ziziphus jujuba var. spinosa]|uniref:Uncharacterized protein n=1 Tax=Ziziphus jujuba var. spinosa TaxID=714518 RepID=A0A978W088_ZIZJJ|nr:hypothetical protein FEM48_Zijuj01G0086600 [Ziziphus jujuba var. spinosa]